MADMKAKLRQHEDKIHSLEKDLQNERETSKSKMSEVQGYYANTILERHAQEVKTKKMQVDKALEDLDAARKQIDKCEKVGAELANAKTQLQAQSKDLDQARNEVKDLCRREKDQNDQMRRDKDRITHLESNIKSLESDKQMLQQCHSELQKLQTFSAGLVDDDLSQV